jgi:dethiobiotin synthetase
MPNHFIIGTTTSAGKHTIASMFLRHIKSLGMKVAPFKPISIDLNCDSGNLSESINYQCALAECDSNADMNPIRFHLTPNSLSADLFLREDKYSLDKLSSLRRDGAIENLLRESVSHLTNKFEVVVGEGSGNITDALSFDMAQYQSIDQLDANVHIVCSDVVGGI